MLTIKDKSATLSTVMSDLFRFVKSSFGLSTQSAGKARTLGGSGGGSSTSSSSSSSSSAAAAPSPSSSSSSAPVSAAERAAARARAAEKREAAWSRRVAAGSSASANARKANATERQDGPLDAPARDAYTERCICEAKRSEAITIQTLGYNPYQPVLSGSSASRSAHRQPPPQQQQGALASEAQGFGYGSESQSVPIGAGANGEEAGRPGGSPRDERVFEEALDSLEALKQSVPLELYEEWSFQADESFGILTTAMEPSGVNEICTCLETIAKMITNVLAYPENPKFSNIRVSNPVFNKKVTSVPGGVEIIMAAGFQLREAEQRGDATAASAAAGVSSTAGSGALGEESAPAAGLATSAEASSNNDNLFLYYDRPHEPISQSRLRIVLCRINILQVELAVEN